MIACLSVKNSVLGVVCVCDAPVCAIYKGDFLLKLD